MLDLTNDQLCAVRNLLRARLPGRSVRAFGSRVEGRARPHSDLDLVVLGETPVRAETWADLGADFEESDLPFRVDLVHWSDLPPPMQQYIGKHSVPIFD